MKPSQLQNEAFGQLFKYGPGAKTLYTKIVFELFAIQIEKKYRYEIIEENDSFTVVFDWSFR